MNGNKDAGMAVSTSDRVWFSRAGKRARPIVKNGNPANRHPGMNDFKVFAFACDGTAADGNRDGGVNV